VCHGIPDDRPLEEGDIVNIDVTVYLNGYHGDTSAMFNVGKQSVRRLITAVYLRLMFFKI
jgi:methionine aminopeptidase